MSRYIPGSHAAFGPGFERVIRERRLEDFPAFDDERATRYVSRILAHGGVPDYCLHDFFDLLAYSIARSEWAGLPVGELVREWALRKFSFIQIDRPVQRFVMHGGSVALDFVQRSLDLIADALDIGSVPLNHEAGLPTRIVSAAGSWIEKRQPQIDASSQHRLRRPRLAQPVLRLDPWGADPFSITLPSQFLPDDAHHAAWVIASGEQTQTIPIRLHDASAATVPTDITLSAPATRWDVSLIVDGQHYASWQIPGVTPQRPIMLINPETGELIRWSDTLPSGECWLLHPQDHTLSVDVSGVPRPLDILESFPVLRGGWRGYRAIWVELPSRAALVTCTELAGTERTHRFAVRDVTHDYRRPVFITTDHTVPAATAGNGLPVLSRAPSLRIPSIGSSGSVPAAWTITVAPQPGSVPGERRIRHANEVTYSYTEDGGILVDLQQPGLMDSDALGTFTVGVRGPLGSDARLEFALVPGIRIHGHHSHAAINRADGEPVSITLESERPITVRALAPDTTVQRQDRGARVETLAREMLLSVTPAEFGTQYLSPLPAVSLQITVAGLRWAIHGVSDVQTIAWSSRAVSLPTDVLRDAVQAGIVFDGFTTEQRHPGRAIMGIAQLTLKSSTEEALQEWSVPIRGARVWLPLSAFSTSIQSHHDAALRFEASIFGPAGEALVLSRPVLQLTRELQVTNLCITELESTTTRRLLVTWDQRFHVRGRVLRIWSVARPWERPCEISIADDCAGSLTLDRSREELTPGPYQFDIIAIDPWSFTASVEPLQAHAIDWYIGRSDELVAGVSSGSDGPLDRLERFLIDQNPAHLDGFSGLLQAEDPAPALAVFQALVRADRVSPSEDAVTITVVIDTLRDALTNHPTLLTALGQWVIGEVPPAIRRGERDDHVVRETFAALGLCQLHHEVVMSSLAAVDPIVRDALERRFPILFLTRIGEGLVATDTEREAAETLFGDEPLEVLLHENGDGQPRIDPWSARGPELRHVFRFAADPHTCALPLMTLQNIRESLGLVPVGVLDPNAALLSVLDCLIELKSPHNQALLDQTTQWVHDAAPRIESMLDHVHEAVRGGTRSQHRGLRIAKSLIAARRTDQSSGLELVPYVVGGTALAQRLRSRIPTGLDLRLGERQSWTYGRSAMLTAPGLYMRDLCLFDLLLAAPCQQMSTVVGLDDQTGAVTIGEGEVSNG